MSVYSPRLFLLTGTLLLGCLAGARPQTAIAADAGDLVLADKGKAHVIIVVSPKAGTWEKRAADDLALYIGLMTGAKPTVAATEESAAAALKGSTPALVIGRA